jgi:DNA-binding PadR family transcriptional regulator
MVQPKKLEKLLPLTEATFYIMLALTTPQHGYAIMQDVDRMSEGVVNVGPGTLYGALTNLEENKLIRKVDEVDRRKIYILTEQGKSVLTAQGERLEVMLRNILERSDSLEGLKDKDG